MSEYTNEEMAEACEEICDAVLTPIIEQRAYSMPKVIAVERLRAAARTLRAMQGREQSSAATPRSSHSARSGAEQSAACGPAADPPPPEDALLREIDAVRAEVRDTFRQIDDIPADHTVRKIDSALRRARDRITADANTKETLSTTCIALRAELQDTLGSNVADDGFPQMRTVDLVNLTKKQAREIIAAEARAKGLEADARRYRQVRPLFEFAHEDGENWWIVHYGLIPFTGDEQTIDAALDALASPDSGKERG